MLPWLKMLHVLTLVLGGAYIALVGFEFRNVLRAQIYDIVLHFSIAVILEGIAL